jgi:type I restriction enzyme S subunit
MIYDLPVEKSSRPPDWCVLELNQLADVVGGGTPDTDEPVYWNPPEIPWVTPTDITACAQPVLTKTERRISRAGLNESSATLLPVGTTLLTSRATVGECRIAGVPAATNQGFASLVPHEGTPPEFLFYLAQTLRPAFVRLAAGTTFVEVSRREVRRVKVCVPSDAGERLRIGNILRLADDAIQALEAKLAAAQRLKTALMQQLFTRGIPGRHTSWKPLRVFRQSYDIPFSWEAARLASCVAQIDYGTNEPSNAEKAGLPVVAIPQVVSARFELKDCDYTVISADEAAALRLAPNDVLLIRTNGNSAYIGKSTVIGREAEQQQIVFASYLIRIRTKPDRLHGRYLNYFLHSPLGRRQSQAMANTSAGNHNLGARSLRQFWIPRPGEEEQTEIVETLDAVEDLLDSLETELEKAKMLKTSLLQNLLTGKVRVKINDDNTPKRGPAFGVQPSGCPEGTLKREHQTRS